MMRAPFGRRAVTGLVAIVSALAPAGLAAAGAGPPGSAAPRVVVSVSAGLSVPAETLARKIYGGRQGTIRFDGEVEAWSPIGLFLSIRAAGAKGATVVTDGRAFEETYPVELTSRSVHAGLLLTRPIGSRTRWFAGAGLAVGSYEERWPALGDPVRRSSVGAVGLGGFHYDVTGRFGVVGRMEVSLLKARDRDEDGRAPNLGGFEISAGAAVRF